MAIFREIGNRPGEATALHCLGFLADQQGDWEGACSLYTQSLTIYREIGHREGEANSLSNLGRVKSSRGDLEAARSLHGQALAIFREIGSRDEAHSLTNMGMAALEEGALAEARALFAQSLTLLRQLGNPGSTLETLEEWAALALAEGNAAGAARLAGATTAGREALTIALPPEQKDTHERTLSGARAALGDEAFTAAWDLGQAMTLDAACEYALTQEWR